MGKLKPRRSSLPFGAIDAIVAQPFGKTSEERVDTSWNYSSRIGGLTTLSALRRLSTFSLARYYVSLLHGSRVGE